MLDNDLNKIIDILNNGGVVALPTDTVYGLIALYGNNIGYNKIYSIKNRPIDKKLILFIDKIDRLNEFCDNIDQDTYNYLNSIWPGDTTVILKCKNNESIGFRIPDNELIFNIISTIDKPLYSTSANVSGSQSVKNFEELDNEIVHKVDFCVKGSSSSGRPSKIIDLQDNKKNIIRK